MVDVYMPQVAAHLSIPGSNVHVELACSHASITADLQMNSTKTLEKVFYMNIQMLCWEQSMSDEMGLQLRDVAEHQRGWIGRCLRQEPWELPNVTSYT